MSICTNNYKPHSQQNHTTRGPSIIRAKKGSGGTKNPRRKPHIKFTKITQLFSIITLVSHDLAALSSTGLILILRGPECHLGGASGDPENESLFLAEPIGDIPPFPAPSGLGGRDLALADSVDAMYPCAAGGQLARLSSSLTDEPAMLCLRHRSD